MYLTKNLKILSKDIRIQILKLSNSTKSSHIVHIFLVKFF